MMDITSKTIRDRILELRRVAARELVPNPQNWRQASCAPSRRAKRRSSRKWATQTRSSHGHYPMAV